MQRLTAETVHAANSAFGVANAATLELKESAVGVAAGDYVKIEDSSVLVLLAPRVSGNVKAVRHPAGGVRVRRRLFRGARSLIRRCSSRHERLARLGGHHGS